MPVSRLHDHLVAVAVIVAELKTIAVNLESGIGLEALDVVGAVSAGKVLYSASCADAFGHKLAHRHLSPDRDPYVQ